MTEPSYDYQKFWSDVDAVAKRMCEEMGLDPSKSAYCLHSDSYPEHGPLIFTTYNPPLTGAPSQGLAVAPPHSYEPQWRGYRRRAAEALASWRAIHKHALTDL